MSKCDVEVSSKSQEIESTTNNRSSLPQPKDSMLATQTDFYLGSARATSLDSTMAREQEISIVRSILEKLRDRFRYSTALAHKQKPYLL